MTVHNIQAEDLFAAIEGEIYRIHQKANAAVEETVASGVRIIDKNVPVAFSELRKSVKKVEQRIVVDAPHAAAVEVGTRPHTPNFERLLAWVKLRGMQGLKPKRDIRRLDGTTTASQAKRVAKKLRNEEVKGKRGKHGRYTPVDAAEKVAWAISSAIEKKGTKPHWYARESLPAIRKDLHRRMRSKIKGK